ncbi:choice-of-anchor L domain-containing protein [Yeosuana sp. MJ-SS3]|uniref:Choice-of-anchor L domain-containing protein n=1 Tax=Gilvirhabdus luticola TaxID=3079858 RepID=A0ABU3U6S4_9FLAO|nr:choice-of-anchor L domain-containing protein [Yeosuana sp. MJ-SS3]MDU8886097.1 choice-of-anchor L domain-containing protein [Yeosuana sp. MJ-SS3]
MKPTYSYILILFFISKFAFSQQISVDNSVPLQTLIEDYLVDGCVEISNISTTVNGISNGNPSYASFNRGSSNFPLESGIVISTGNANSGGNSLNTTDLSEGTAGWGTDPDIETALGITNTLNATSIEFDFISVSSQVQFNYIFASEEYSNIWPCQDQYADGFVFLIRPTASTVYNNIALVPGTSDEVGSNTIHDEIFGVCLAENEQYFDGYNLGDTNYNGRTTVLTANYNTTPYVQYHIKLIIADKSDYTLDSAVFIEASSFTNLDLGEDITTCAGSVPLDGDIQNPQASYQWYFNNSLISGQTNPTINASQSGTYRLEITLPLNNSNCIIDDEVNVTIDSEQSANPISNYELCDNGSDGIEQFDLTNMDAEVMASVPSGSYNFSYHYSDSDARNNVNSINSSISNSSNPQSIFVRIEDTNTGCLAYATFDLVVNALPNVTAPTTLVICEDEVADGYTGFDLTSKDNEITSGQSNLNVTYHFTQADADNGVNSILSPYYNINTPNDQLFVRVTDTQTGCARTTTLDLTIIDSPIINRDPVYIDACDQDYDGFATFDLTSVISGILQGLSNVTTTFHLNLADAQSGSNAIPNANNYQNIDPEEQVLYIRVEDNNNGCPAIMPIEVHTNMLLTATAIQNFALCDDEGNDGIEDFSLTAIANVITNGIPNVNISFYETQADLNNGTNEIDASNPYTATSPQTLYISLGDGNCTEESEITLYVNPVLLFNPVNPIDYCDTDEDGFTSIDLDSFDPIVTSGNPNFGVRYFTTQADAETGVNQLPQFYTNVSNPETIFARIENVDTGCFTVNSFEVNVLPTATVSQPSNIIICDSDQDGFSVINLDSKIPEIVSDSTGLDISFFTDNDDAINNTNSITGTTAYNANSQTIFTRVETTMTGCYAIVSFDILVNTLPNFPNITSFQLCEDDNDQIADFLLVDKDLEILNGQTDKVVSYYETQIDADNATNEIDKNSFYQNTSSPQTIYVRVENISDINCYGTSSFTIQVAANPEYNPPTSYLVCDDISNDGISEFDFNEKVAEISQGIANPLNISFHVSLQDAEENINQQSFLFTNTENPQQIYVRIENSASTCVIIEEFGINIIPAPSVTLAEPFEQCDIDYDSIVNFDLTMADFQILDIRQNDLTIQYFESLTDLELNANAIANANNYSNLSNPQTVYIKVTNTVTQCYSAIPLDLIVNVPPSVNNIGTVDTCDNDTDTYDLSHINNLLVNNVNDVIISYHNSQSEAETYTNPLGSTFNYTASNHTIYARIIDAQTGCPIVTSFILQINQNPIANSPQDLIACDDDYDGFLAFDLSVQDSQIIGSQDPSNFTISYYDSFDNAENGTNSLNNSHSSSDGEIIFARIVNNATGCFDTTQFMTIVNPLPVININDVVAICRNDLPLIVSADTGNIGYTYLWSTGETSSEIALGLEDVGDYWVTVNTALGCNATRSFSARESEEANIEFTTTVDFADPNSITISVSGIGDYVFILDNGLEQTSNVFNNVSLGPHIVTVRDLFGCRDVSQEVVVIDAPKFVTPNNDGYFDSWHIAGIDQLPGTMVYIYDRYGKLLKTLTHTSEGWNGMFNGKYMPSDDYWFVAQVKRGTSEFDVKGHFALKR